MPTTKAPGSTCGRFFAQIIRCGDLHPAEKYNGQRHLKGDTKGHKKPHHKIEIAANLCRNLHASRYGVRQERKHQREYHKVGLVGAKLQNATSDFFELDSSKNYSLVKWLP